jgi:hypothetical protein
MSKPISEMTDEELESEIKPYMVQSEGWPPPREVLQEMVRQLRAGEIKTT